MKNTLFMFKVGVSESNIAIHFMRLIFVIVWFAISLVDLFSQSLSFKTLCTLPDELKESSGLVTLNEGKSFWTHGDSGHGPSLFEIDTQCRILRIVEITNAINIDWEEITTDFNGNIFIGDFGNNQNDRKDLVIYIIENLQQSTLDKIEAKKISFSYKNQNAFPPNAEFQYFDMESFIWYKDSLHLFSKNRSNPFNGLCYQYSLPAIPGNYLLEPVDSFNTGTIHMLLNWVCGASLTPDKNKLLLLGYDKIWSFENFSDSRFFTGSVKIFTHTFSQTEAVTFINQNELLVTDEYNPSIQFGGNLYKTTLPIPSKTKHEDQVKILHKNLQIQSVLRFEDYWKAPICIYDMFGKKILSLSVLPIEIDLSSLPAGFYYAFDYNSNTTTIIKLQ